MFPTSIENQKLQIEQPFGCGFPLCTTNEQILDILLRFSCGYPCKLLTLGWIDLVFQEGVLAKVDPAGARTGSQAKVRLDPVGVPDSSPGSWPRENDPE
jgi:hypothetical protein